MHPLFGEVAPAAPALLEPLLALLLFAVALGVITLVSYIVYGIVQILNRTVGRLPGVGSAITGAANYFESVVSTAMGKAVGAIDRDISFWWHALTAEVEWLGKQIEDTAGVLLTVASLASGHPNARARAWIAAAIGLALKPVDALAHEAEKGVLKLERKLAHGAEGVIGGAIASALKPVLTELHGLEQWTYPKVQGVEGEITNVIYPGIADLRSRATEIENAAIQVYRDAAGVYHAVNVDALTAAVAIALPTLGLEWLRCSSASGLARARGCGLWSGLSSLLGLLVDVYAVTHICELLPELDSLISELAVPVVDELTQIGAGLCTDSIGVAPPLTPPKLHLPVYAAPVLHLA